jgi:EAL domain-containing protein (putative c-di-GMP-specific phosphodiesterase class I)/GGDEF domain-containing protein
MNPSKPETKSLTEAALQRRSQNMILPEKSNFMERLEETLAESRIRASALAVLIISIDRMSSGGKRNGIEEEEALISEAVLALKRNLSSGEYLAYLGGLDFGLFMSRISGAADALAKQTQLHELFRALRSPGQHTVSIGISLGSQDGTKVGALFSRASVAMKHARLNGGACSQFYEQETHDRMQDNMRMEVEMRLGMKRGEFKLVYQPLRSLKDGSCESAEALLRWDHPVDGPISPVRFIPVAEECGFIRQLGKWVIERACDSLAELAAMGLPSFKIAVNLSPKQFSDPALLSSLRRSLIVRDVDPCSFGIEVTESCAMQDMDFAIDVLKELQGYGMQLSLDDFGSGFSSLSQLRRFPLANLKLDKSFIDEIASSREAATIVNAVIGLAHSLDLVVTAEGVETVQQHELLAEMGCDIAQGYLISKPLEFERLIQFVAEPMPSASQQANYQSSQGYMSAVAA